MPPWIAVPDALPSWRGLTRRETAALGLAGLLVLGLSDLVVPPPRFSLPPLPASPSPRLPSIPPALPQWPPACPPVPTSTARSPDEIEVAAKIASRGTDRAKAAGTASGPLRKRPSKFPRSARARLSMPQSGAYRCPRSCSPADCGNSVITRG